MTACLSRPIGWSMAIVLRDIVHDASHVDQEKKRCTVFFLYACMWRCSYDYGAPLGGTWAVGASLSHFTYFAERFKNIKNNQIILFCLVHKTSYSIK